MEPNAGKSYDVVIVGGGPGGLSAALALGRARKDVLLCDGGPRRNAAAGRVHNFLTRDGTPPDDLRRIAREQLAAYPNVEVRDVPIASIAGERGSFLVELASGTVTARRVLLCTGVIDEMMPVDGFRELWGRSIFQCPYCHGWENKDRPWGYLAREAHATHLLPFALQLRGWSSDIVVFTNGAFEISREANGMLDAAGVRVENRPIARLAGADHRLASVELADGTSVPREVLFAHPPQRQVELVRTLGLQLDDDGFVRVDAMTRQTSVPGVFAAGDLTARMQGAILAAAAGTQAAAIINVELMTDRARAA